MEEGEKIKENTILEISLSEKIIDRTSEFDFDFSSLNNESSSLGLDNVLTSIDKAKHDDNIKGIYLNIDMVNASMATLQEIRDKLQEFKDLPINLFYHTVKYILKKQFIFSVPIKLHSSRRLFIHGINMRRFFKEALKN